MKRLTEYTHCLPGGGMLVIRGIPRLDGGLIVLTIEYYPAISAEAA